MAATGCSDPGTSAATPCGNGVQDEGEAGVDCGGSCAACAVDNPCANGVQDEGEAGVDCGGACTPCGQPATCSDGAHNQDESDIDCGGAICPLCVDTRACRRDEDCVSENCELAVCVPPVPTCVNGAKDPDETDLDCGGACPGCPEKKRCNGNDDCLSDSCILGLCENQSCSDRVLNNGESDVDCGGENCLPCPNDRACVVTDDCETQTCIDQVCRPFGTGTGACTYETDCISGYYCDYEDNNGFGANAAFESQCELEISGGQPGDPCRYNSDCAGLGCNAGSCTEACADDAQCGAGNVCALAVQSMDGPAIIDRPQCRYFDEPGAACLTHRDCAAGERCSLYVDEIAGRPVEGPRTVLGRCEAELGVRPEGALCDDDPQCGSGYCKRPDYRCTSYCNEDEDCPATNIEGEHPRYCIGIVIAQGQAADRSDWVYAGGCTERYHQEPLVPCGPSAGASDFSCAFPNKCAPRAIAHGPDSKGIVEWSCEGTGTNALPNGNTCTDNSGCATNVCAEVADGVRKCAAPCVTNADCSNGKPCVQKPILRRVGRFASNTIKIGVCQ